MRSLRSAVLVTTAAAALVVVGIPNAYAAVDCNRGKPENWEVVPEGSSGGDLGLICNYRVVKKLPDGSTSTSGTAIEIEYFCTADAGEEAFESKTGPRDTETLRSGNKLVIEEGPAARNPDNPHRDGVFSSFFPGETFDLFEKEWLLFANRQAIATIVVITNKTDGRHSVADAEAPARTLAFHNAPTSPDCTVPVTDVGPVASTASPGTKTGTVATGGGVDPAVVAAAAAAAGGGTAVVVVRRRRRVKFKPPKPAGLGPNKWDPTVEEQRRRWGKDRKVWDPDHLTWRDPRPEDFEEIPEQPQLIEQQIPVHTVPAECLDTYWRYVKQRGRAGDLHKLIQETNIKLKASEERLRANRVRAHVQLGFDIGGAIGGVTASALDAARAAVKPASVKGGRMPGLSELGDEVRARLRARTAEINAELDAIRGRIAKAQAEMDGVGDAARIANAVDDAADDLSSLRRQLGELDDSPAALRAKRDALIAEDRELRVRFDQLSNDKKLVQDFLEFRKVESFAWEKQPAYQDFAKRQAELDKELDDIVTKAGHTPGGPVPKLSPEAEARFDEILRIKQANGAVNDAAFERFVRMQEGYDHNWPSNQTDAVSRRDAIRQEQADIGARKRQIRADEEAIEDRMMNAREGVSPDRARLARQIAEAEQRHADAVARKKQLDDRQAQMSADKAAEAAEQQKLTGLQEEAQGVLESLAKVADRTGPGVAPAVLLGGMLAWLSPAAAAMGVVTILAWAGADALGIGPDSPGHIWKTLWDNKMERDELVKTLEPAEKEYVALVEELPKTRASLNDCMAPTPAPPGPER